jgi:hypothetical protein
MNRITPFTKADDKNLLKLKKTMESADRKVILDAMAKALKLAPKQVYQRWHYLHTYTPGAKSKNKTAKLAKNEPAKLITMDTTGSMKMDKVNAVKARKGKSVVPYVLEDGADVNMRGFMPVSLEARLRPLLSSMQPFGTVINNQLTRHTVPIMRAEKESVRKWMITAFPDRKYSISAIADNKSMVRIVRKA